MAIMSTMDQNVWISVEEFIRDVILNRKCQFGQSEILDIIKKRMVKTGMDSNLVNCSYFHVIFLNVLDDLVEKGILYPMETTYIPLEYMILNEYDTKKANLLYFSSKVSSHLIYINLDTLEETVHHSMRDFILTGGISDNPEEGFIEPSIPLQEIASLYHSFLEEGAAKEEAICHVLNYYKIERLTPMNELGNVVLVKEKKRRLLKMELKKDKVSNS